MEIGIVGLPNVGKSTLFNALLKRQVAFAANYPFATIEPNVGVVGVPDKRLEYLAETIAGMNSNDKIQITNQIENSNYQFLHRDKWPPIVPATVKFVDIAGLVKGASQGEGLGNKFLSHIREVDAIAMVLRDFSDENVIRAGSENPKSDREVLEAELILADAEVIEKIQNSKLKSTNQAQNSKYKSAAEKIHKLLMEGKPAREAKLDEEEAAEAKPWGLLTAKPVMVVMNTDENGAGVGEGEYICICAKMEAELAELAEPEQAEYLKQAGITESGLVKLIKKGYEILGLQSFLTAGVKEVRAWTVRMGAKAPEAAGVIHTDFEKHFIKADCINWEEFVAVGGWAKAREAGKVRQEGREYVMREGDVVEFKVGV